jgi:hypothetical protein
MNISESTFMCPSYFDDEFNCSHPSVVCPYMHEDNPDLLREMDEFEETSAICRILHERNTQCIYIQNCANKDVCPYNHERGKGEPNVYIPSD